MDAMGSDCFQSFGPPWFDGQIHLCLEVMVKEMKGSIVTCEPKVMPYGLKNMELGKEIRRK